MTLGGEFKMYHMFTEDQGICDLPKTHVLQGHNNTAMMCLGDSSAILYRKPPQYTGSLSLGYCGK